MSQLGTYVHLHLHLQYIHVRNNYGHFAENNIKDFMKAYRSANKRVTPKLHMLEDHIVAEVGFH